jgi:stage V sporulation protein G
MDLHSMAPTRFTPYRGEGSLRAFCDLNVGNLFVIKGLRVVDGKHGLFVGLPRQQGKDGKWYNSVIPCSDQVKTEMNRIVLEAYEQGETNGRE